MTDTGQPVTQESNFGAAPSEAQMHEALKQDIAHAQHKGWMTKEAATAELQRIGAPPADEILAPHEKPAPAQPQALAGLEPARADQFRFPNLDEIRAAERDAFGRAPPPLSPAEVMKSHQVFGGWMEAAKLPASIGNSLADAAGKHIKAMPDYANMSAADKALHRAAEQAKLERLWGEKTRENVAYAQRVVDLVDAQMPAVDGERVALSDFLAARGLNHNSYLVIQLAQHGRRIFGTA